MLLSYFQLDESYNYIHNQMEHVHGPNCGCKQFLGAQDAGDLYGAIHLEAVRCLGEKSSNTGKRVFKPYSNRFDKSGFVSSKQGDPELLYVIPFTSQVKLRSICVIAKSETKAPTKMALYVNQKNVSFSITEEAPIQEFALVPNLGGQLHNAVKQSKFNEVSELIIFFKSTADEQIEISYIQLKGEDTGLKRQAVKTVYELKPSANKLDLDEVTKNNIHLQ